MMDPNADQKPIHQKQGKEKSLGGSSIFIKTPHPNVKANVGQNIRIIIDTGASSSYVFSDLITKLLLKPKRREHRCIEQMYGAMTFILCQI